MKAYNFIKIKKYSINILDISNLFKDSYNALINHEEYVDIVKKSGIELLGKEKIVTRKYSEMGAEDFAYYLEKVPGAFFFLGIRNEEIGATEPLHNDKFMVDEILKL